MNTRTARSLAVVAGLAVAGLGTAPAFAATPAAKPTSITLKAAHSTVKPSQKDTLTGLLKSGNKALAGQTVLLEKRAAGTKTWNLVSSKTTNSKGQVVLTVTPGTKKGKKEQFELLFKGTKAYKASHSAVITITVS